MSNSIDRIEAIRAAALERIAATDSLDNLEVLRVEFTGRKAELVLMLRGIKDLPDDEKRLVGPAANAARAALELAIDDRHNELSRAAEAALLATDRVDLSLPGRTVRRGDANPLVSITNRIVDAFVGMGYSVAEGPEVETEWHAFEALNIPADHPTRTDMDSFYVTGPAGERALLRPHTSPVQVRTMQAQKPPIYVVVPGRCFRRDETDATHSPTFHQIECLAVDKGLTMADLKGTLQEFARAAFGPNERIRLVPTFFPFTEPSAQLEVSCLICGGSGCSQCASGWLEIGGAGMVDPNVLEACGIDPEEYTGFAFGMGLERAAMIRYGVPDIRLFLDSGAPFLGSLRGIEVAR